MKIISGILFIAAVLLISYGYWGAFTSSGNKVYDEMDAFFPFFMLVAGVVALIASLIVFIIMWRKRKRINPQLL